MKIITRGIPPEEKLYRSLCIYCKTVFQYIAKEAKLVSDQREGDYLSIACPVCNQPVTQNPHRTYNGEA